MTSIIESEYINEEVRSFLEDLYSILTKRRAHLESWLEATEHVVDYMCFIDPLFWDLAYEDFKKLKKILKLCIELKRCFEVSKHEMEQNNDSES